jgi:hypothetical protein
MTKREFVTMYVLLKESTTSYLSSTEEAIEAALHAWAALHECKELEND